MIAQQNCCCLLHGNQLMTLGHASVEWVIERYFMTYRYVCRLSLNTVSGVR